MLVPYRQQLAALLDGKVATTTLPFDNGGVPVIQRSGETPLGDLIADGMRWRYGTQLALMNGGGIRQQLPTCSYQPTDHSLKRSVYAADHVNITTCSGYASGGPYDIVLGDIFSVLPFGNIITTRTATGAQIWGALENGVSQINSTTGNGADGRFPHISGFKFTFDYGNAPGSRVIDVRLSDGTPIPNSASASYTLALPNFQNLGGDGYTVFADGKGATQELDAVVLKEYLQSIGTNLDPASFPLDRITKQP
jgi:5'-nucleotidase